MSVILTAIVVVNSGVAGRSIFILAIINYYSIEELDDCNISTREVDVGESVLLSIICFHFSIFLSQTGFGGYSLSAEIIKVATLEEIFTGCPSGPAIVMYFLE